MHHYVKNFLCDDSYNAEGLWAFYGTPDSRALVLQYASISRSFDVILFLQVPRLS